MKSLAPRFVAGIVASRAGAAPIHDVAVRDIDGREVKMDAYRGKVMLIVNVASECGYTRAIRGVAGAVRSLRSQGPRGAGFSLQSVRRAGAGVGGGDQAILLHDVSCDLPLI
jgi:hypothetical protein